MNHLLRLVAPGTPIREGLENVLRAKTGGLIVFGSGPEVMKVADGGFAIDCEFSPHYLYELAKMDGAIILSEDAGRILYANTQLIPDSSIASAETGIRHRTAERVARQTGKLVVSISQRRHVITLYQGNLRYALKESGTILAKANQAVQTLERYRTVFTQALTNLSALEFESLVTMHEVAYVLQRAEMVLRIRNEIQRYVLELGNEGRLIGMQMEELIGSADEEARLLIKDYAKDAGEDKVQDIQQAFGKLTSEELLGTACLMRLLGYTALSSVAEEGLQPRGYRILSKIPRLPSVVIHNVVGRFASLTRILFASVEELDEVDGIGEARARAIIQGLKRIQEQVFVDRQI